MKVLNVDDVKMAIYIMTSYRKIKIAREKIINYNVISPSRCQIRILVGERPGISVIICCYLFRRKKSFQVNIF